MFSCIKSVSCVCISLIRGLSITSKFPSAISLNFMLATSSKLKLQQHLIIWRVSSCLPIVTHILCLTNLYKSFHYTIGGHFNRPCCMMKTVTKVHSLLISSVLWLLYLFKKQNLMCTLGWHRQISYFICLSFVWCTFIVANSLSQFLNLCLLIN